MSDKPMVWLKVCALEDVPTDKASDLFINNQRFVITRYADQAYILQGFCSHMLYFFKDAPVDGCVLTCELHGSQFDIRDGSVIRWTEAIGGPLLEEIRKKKNLRSLATKVDNGMVYVAWPTDKPERVRIRR